MEMCSSEALHARGGGSLKGLQPTAGMPWRGCGPWVTRTRVGTSPSHQSPPGQGHSQRECGSWRTYARAGTPPKGLWPMNKPHWSRRKQVRRLAERNIMYITSNLVPQITAVLLPTAPQLVTCGISPAQDAFTRFSSGRDSWGLQLRHIHVRGTREVDPPLALPAHSGTADSSQSWHQFHKFLFPLSSAVYTH